MDGAELVETFPSMFTADDLPIPWTESPISGTAKELAVADVGGTWVQRWVPPVLKPTIHKVAQRVRARRARG